MNIRRNMIMGVVKVAFYIAIALYLNYIVYTLLKSNRGLNENITKEENDLSHNRHGLLFDGVMCLKHPLFFKGDVPKLTMSVPEWTDLSEDTKHLQHGGKFKPNCTNPNRVAIIIPYRDREEQLKVFLKYMHRFLQHQNLQYGIFVIELENELTFNRGLLLNIGFLEATKRDNNYECYIFHDVDLLPEWSFNIYKCQKFPTHMCSAIDKFDYTLPYDTIFGGVNGFRKEQFEKVNGYSNLYFGWGGEDDDMWERVHSKEMQVIRVPLDVGRYKMINHTREKLNQKNYFRHKLLENAAKRMTVDGINSVKYKIVNVEETTYHTKIIVRIFRSEYHEHFYINCNCK